MELVTTLSQLTVSEREHAEEDTGCPCPKPASNGVPGQLRAAGRLWLPVFSSSSPPWPFSSSQPQGRRATISRSRLIRPARRRTTTPTGHGSQYKKNLDQFLAALPTAAGDNGWFYKGSAGSGPDAVFGLIMCFADRDASDCLYCISTASAGITTACPGSRNVSAAYDACVLRYSAAPIPTTADLGYVFAEPLTPIGMPVTSEAVPHAWVPLMIALSSGIAFDTSRSFRRSMAYSSTGSQEMKMYGLAQCTRDLNGSECSTCIRSYAIRLGKLFPNHTGCSIKGYSCYLRYMVSFLIDITLPPAPPTSSPPTPGTHPPAAASFIRLSSSTDAGQQR
ncbi:unnamed protein product [Miscanthus lutarioriparius]|uniref:Gnk2-homologous domain-containing protein n=1 Tax=Miscanthus lutarioriparius TaxID=422564 RepID=A0A811RAY3_9POAL|nr:unnamed protein product [Miscanthus lutarioriparius]